MAVGMLLAGSALGSGLAAVLLGWLLGTLLLPARTWLGSDNHLMSSSGLQVSAVHIIDRLQLHTVLAGGLVIVLTQEFLW
jgi:hypothetical protein